MKYRYLSIFYLWIRNKSSSGFQTMQLLHVPLPINRGLHG